ncbi:hypothetical protein L2E82_40351 [Cichorium intybus]|uniref:Uncharacterized protein n=1 Tax=Cichorium intybus TaxID=13427 RepID=A0ACB9AK89_CICIN|nr:hypothetical protein L2E82_40351 [Cichorium intybus]
MTHKVLKLYTVLWFHLYMICFPFGFDLDFLFGIRSLLLIVVRLWHVMTHDRSSHEQMGRNISEHYSFRHDYKIDFKFERLQILLVILFLDIIQAKFNNKQVQWSGPEKGYKKGRYVGRKC